MLTYKIVLKVLGVLGVLKVLRVLAASSIQYPNY